MANNSNPGRKISSRPAGFFLDLANRFRLIGRLMMDSRVNPLLKILPVGTLIYVVSPIDLLPINPVDDAFIIWAGTTLFVELCPPDVVDEHTQQLQHALGGNWKDFTSTASTSAPADEVIDGEFVETDRFGKKKTP